MCLYIYAQSYCFNTVIVVYFSSSFSTSAGDSSCGQCPAPSMTSSDSMHVSCFSHFLASARAPMDPLCPILGVLVLSEYPSGLVLDNHQKGL